MRVFPEEPSVSKAPSRYQKRFNPTLWVLDDDYKITLLNGKQIIIHSGFMFSASVPWPFWIFIKPTGSIFIAGLVHDLLYVYNQFNWDQKQCDYIFWETAERVKKRVVMHNAAYYSVRIGGKKAWDEHRMANLQRV